MIEKKEEGRFSSDFNSAMIILERLNNMFSVAYIANTQHNYNLLYDILNNIYTELSPFIKNDKKETNIEKYRNELNKVKQELNLKIRQVKAHKNNSQAKKFFLRQQEKKHEEYKECLHKVLRELRRLQESYDMGMRAKEEIRGIALRGRF